MKQEEWTKQEKKCILIIDCIDYDSSLFESSWSSSSFELNVVEFSFVHDGILFFSFVYWLKENYKF